MVESHAKSAAYEAIFGDVAMHVDGVRRATPDWPDWAITTRIDATAHWQQVYRAIGCHQTQLTSDALLARLPAAQHRFLWGTPEYYRAFSLVNGGRAVEDDLFAGLP
jgi:LmbE family N-acetylglucosaminyl deacetylase